MTKQSTYEEARDRAERINQACREVIELQAWLPREPRQESTYTYFIQVADEMYESVPGGGPIKIGCAADPAARLLALQTASPYRLVLMGYVAGGERLERELHKKYAHLHLRGEWFNSTEALEHELYGMIIRYDEGQLDD